MSLLQDLWKFLGPLSSGFTESFTTSCDLRKPDPCRNDTVAFNLKLASMASIFITGAAGVSIPLIKALLPSNTILMRVAKSFAAGVILATGFVHMLSGGSEAFSDICLPEFPWKIFPFSEFFAMIAALLTLLADLMITGYYERKQEEMMNVSDESFGLATVPDPGTTSDLDLDIGIRHVVVSQILEMGIVSHSIIIGLSLGVSHSPCTIRPLLIALSFHQFFEGFALGGCIAEAKLTPSRSSMMAFFFAVTTPIGVAMGLAIASSYNPYSVVALVAEGVLDSFSAGILVYMALVDLIAFDFLSKKMSFEFKLQVVSYCFLFLGAVMMSALAIWA